MRLRAVIVSSLALLGCASAPAVNCAAVDWRALGINDGLRGDHAEKSRLASACGIRPESTTEAARYLDGWREGVSRYCEPANAFALGASGAEYNGVCNGPEAAEFAAAFRAGEELHERRAAVAAARRSVSAATSNLWDFKRRIAELEGELLSTDLDADERRSLRAEIRSLRAEAENVSRSIELGERALGEANAAYDRLEARLAADGYAPGALRPATASY